MTALNRFPFQCPGAFLCFLLLFGGEAVCAQSTDAPPVANATSGERWVPTFGSVGVNALNIARAPLQLNSTNRLLMAGASGVALGALLRVDAPTYRRLSVRDGTAATATKPLTVPGQWYDRVGPNTMALSTAGVLAASGVALKKKGFTRTSVRVVESLLYTNLVTSALKAFVGRSRPRVGEGAHSVDLAEIETDHNELSMPSGHTARAFALASVLAHQAERWYVSVPAYGMAASVGMERVRSGDHWMTDVMVGGVLGYLIGRSVTIESPTISGARIRPLLSPDRAGLSIRF